MSAKTKAGFTLLEVLIALSIMVLILASILSVQSSSLSASTRARELNTVALLARNLMIETEAKIEGRAFTEVAEETDGVFPEPYQDFRWKVAIKEVEFPQLDLSGASAAGGASGAAGAADQGYQGPADPGANQSAEMIVKLITNFLSKAIREVQVTIYWKRGNNDVDYSVSLYWVDLNHEFSLSG